MAVSNTAGLFSDLFTTFLWLAIIVGAVVFGIMVYLIVKYREKDPSAPEPEDAPTLGKMPHVRGKLRTIAISLSLSTIILVVLVFGTLNTINIINNPPERGTLRINVIGERFNWNFVYPNGYQEVGRLRVPIGEVVILDVTSIDVFHGFGIIDFKIKTDAIPGRTNRIWFNATETGEYTIQCYEFCGVGHANMRAQLIVMTPQEFRDWYSSLQVGK